VCCADMYFRICAYVEIVEGGLECVLQGEFVLCYRQIYKGDVM
jgi:hypothetical protein